MFDFLIKLADVPFRVRCLFESTKGFASEYQTSDSPFFTVEITQADIDNEREISRQQDMQDRTPIQLFPDSYLETIALYRKLAEPLLAYNCMIFHGAVVAVNGAGYLFTAKSGTGKTTHIKLWEKNIENCCIINGDKPLIKIENGCIMAFGTPWCGKEGYGINAGVPLKALCVLGRGADNHISEISALEAFPMLYQQAHHMEQVDSMEKIMQLLGQMADNVSLYRLRCNMEDEAAFVAYHAMSGACQKHKRSTGAFL